MPRPRPGGSDAFRARSTQRRSAASFRTGQLISDTAASFWEATPTNQSLAEFAKGFPIPLSLYLA